MKDNNSTKYNGKIAFFYKGSWYHRKKELLAKEGDLSKLPSPYDLGFNTTGPWSRMRHPRTILANRVSG